MSSLNASLRPVAAALFFATLCAGSTDALAASVVPGDDAVIASRGGAQLTLLEVDARIMELPEHLRADYLDSPQRIDDTVNAMLLEKQLAQAALASPSLKSNPYFEIQAEQARMKYIASQATALVDTSVTPDFELLAEEKYRANTAKYTTKDMRNLRHVLITDRGRDDATARATIEKVRDLARSGTDFQKLVEEYSEEQGGNTNGRLDNVRPGAMVKEFEDAAFALQNEGDISDVVKTRFGYHVIRLDKKIAPMVSPFASVKKQIVDDLRKQYEQKQKQDLVDQFRSAKIEANPEVVASLRTRYTAAGPKVESAPKGAGSTGASAAN